MLEKLLTFAIGAMLTASAAGCVKPTTFNPYAAPGKAELDRLQNQINARPDLEIVENQLGTLDAEIRSVIARYAPKAGLPPSEPTTSGCFDPFGFNIGQTYEIGRLSAGPGVTSGDWSEIRADLTPIIVGAGFRRSSPPSDEDFSFTRDDGADIELRYLPGRLLYTFTTGCHLPAAWRTGPPPPDLRPSDDPGIHYPYLYGPPGGRSGEPG